MTADGQLVQLLTADGWCADYHCRLMAWGLTAGGVVVEPAR